MDPEGGCTSEMGGLLRSSTTPQGENWIAYLHAFETVFELDDPDLAFRKLSALENAIEEMESETDQFNDFCQIFPYEQFLEYGISRNNPAGRLALLCVQICFNWPGLDFRRFESDIFLDFFLHKLMSNDTDLLDLSVQFLCNMCMVGSNVPEILIERGVLDNLRARGLDHQVGKLVCSLCAVKHRYYLESIPVLGEMLSSTDEQTVVLALVAIYQVFHLDESARAIASSVLVDHMTPLLSQDNTEIVKELFIDLALVRQIDDHYYGPIISKMSILSEQCPKIIDLGCRILRMQWNNWKAFDHTQVCQFLFAVASHQRFDIMKSCLITLVLYFSPEYGRNEELIQLLADHLADTSDVSILLHGICRSLEYLACRGCDTQAILTQSHREAILELLNSEVPDVSDTAAAIISMLEISNTT